MTKKHAQQFRNYIRSQTNCHEDYMRFPIEVIDGKSAPVLTGDSYHWETPSGKPVRYPSAYRKAFGKPVYCASTNAFQVGRGWLRARRISPLVCDVSNDVSDVPVFA